MNNIDQGEYTYNTDHEMTILRFESIDGKNEIGMINFYPVHAVNLNNTNLLVAGDNKGYASYLFEKLKNPSGTLSGQGAFVAAFGQSNEGDVSPNLMGPKCIDTGLPCEFYTSTCNGRSEKYLYDKAQVFINGNGIVNFRHTYVDMQTINVSSHFTSTGRNETTCQAALGYAFAAGTTDGPGDFDFTQSANSTNIFWAILNHLIIIFSNLLKETWTSDSHIVIAGLANSYSHYITTYEEYQQQRYEGASTLYGPHTLAAYQQTFYDSSLKLARNESVPSDPQPFDMRIKTFSFVLPPIPDGLPIDKNFGDIITDVDSTYKPGDTVRYIWWGANPRNDLFTEKSFLYVDRLLNQTWVTILTDDDLETHFLWKRQFIDNSIITVEWDIPTTQQTGQDLYRLRHVGVKKILLVVDSTMDNQKILLLATKFLSINFVKNI
ncbi:unnamed protein product [Rotaria sp. Silwood2]|nr:unnamed protein product [Rotaria sp. Silwood2]CAF4459178.1 unnamed protein product [Rotaria sp. Silwood2]CAF4500774.1 unnamed protein product [Rotaria sp. Silwood2]